MNDLILYDTEDGYNLDAILAVGYRVRWRTR